MWPHGARSSSTCRRTPRPARSGVPPSTRTSATSTSTQAQLLERDKIDSGRATAPLVQADGALAVDTTHLTLDEVVDLIVGLVEEHS